MAGGREAPLENYMYTVHRQIYSKAERAGGYKGGVSGGGGEGEGGRHPAMLLRMWPPPNNPEEGLPSNYLVIRSWVWVGVWRGKPFDLHGVSERAEANLLTF